MRVTEAVSPATGVYTLSPASTPQKLDPVPNGSALLAVCVHKEFVYDNAFDPTKLIYYI